MTHWKLSVVNCDIPDVQCILHFWREKLCLSYKMQHIWKWHEVCLFRKVKVCAMECGTRI